MSPPSAPPTTTPSSAPSGTTRPRTSPSTARPLLPPNLRHTPPLSRQRRNPEPFYCGAATSGRALVHPEHFSLDSWLPCAILTLVDISAFPNRDNFQHSRTFFKLNSFLLIGLRIAPVCLAMLGPLESINYELPFL